MRLKTWDKLSVNIDHVYCTGFKREKRVFQMREKGLDRVLEIQQNVLENEFRICIKNAPLFYLQSCKINFLSVLKIEYWAVPSYPYILSCDLVRQSNLIRI